MSSPHYTAKTDPEEFERFRREDRQRRMAIRIYGSVCVLIGAAIGFEIHRIFF